MSINKSWGVNMHNTSPVSSVVTKRTLWAWLRAKEREIGAALWVQSTWLRKSYESSRLPLLLCHTWLQCTLRVQITFLHFATRSCIHIILGRRLVEDIKVLIGHCRYFMAVGNVRLDWILDEMNVLLPAVFRVDSVAARCHWNLD